MKKQQPSRELLTLDIQQVSKLCTPTQVTRNYYRAHGTFTEAQWQEFFPTFGSFLTAAGLKDSSPDDEDPLEDILPYTAYPRNVGAIFEHEDGKKYQVVAVRDSSVTVKRYQWFDKMLAYWLPNV